MKMSLLEINFAKDFSFSLLSFGELPLGSSASDCYYIHAGPTSLVSVTRIKKTSAAGSITTYSYKWEFLFFNYWTDLLSGDRE